MQTEHLNKEKHEHFVSCLCMIKSAGKSSPLHCLRINFLILVLFLSIKAHFPLSGLNLGTGLSDAWSSIPPQPPYCVSPPQHRGHMAGRCVSNQFWPCSSQSANVTKTCRIHICFNEFNKLQCKSVQHFLTSGRQPMSLIEFSQMLDTLEKLWGIEPICQV